jgi:hypothetical protein
MFILQWDFPSLAILLLGWLFSHNQNFPIDENILLQIFSNDNKIFFSFEGITPWTGFKSFPLLG